MLIKFDPTALVRIKAHEYLTRFLLGGASCVAAGLIAERFGPVVGGIFLAFPAIFPASATLVEKHELERKRRAGIAFTFRGRLTAALDARGASLGAFALMLFAILVWKLIPIYHPAIVLGIASAAWAALATVLWRLRRLHTRFWIQRHAEMSSPR
jgi:Protein of unknown function (DUF3147)